MQTIAKESKGKLSDAGDAVLGRHAQDIAAALEFINNEKSLGGIFLVRFLTV
jgi:hypothetical protein